MAYKIKKSDMIRTLETRNSIYELMKESPLVKFRMKDLWKLFKVVYPNDPEVLKWKLRKKERHGFSPATAVALSNDKRFLKTSNGRRIVYWELA